MCPRQSTRSGQLSILLAERNGAFELARRIQNTNLTRAKTRAALRVIDRLILNTPVAPSERRQSGRFAEWFSAQTGTQYSITDGPNPLAFSRRDEAKRRVRLDCNVLLGRLYLYFERLRVGVTGFAA
jgi:hypothetical protein